MAGYVSKLDCVCLFRSIKTVKHVKRDMHFIKKKHQIHWCLAKSDTQEGWYQILTATHLLPSASYIVLGRRNIAERQKGLVEKIPGALFQGGGLRSTTFVIINQNVRLSL